MFYQRHKRIILTLLLTALVGVGVFGILNFSGQVFVWAAPEEPLPPAEDSIPDIPAPANPTPAPAATTPAPATTPNVEPGGFNPTQLIAGTTPVSGQSFSPTPYNKGVYQRADGSQFQYFANGSADNPVYSITNLDKSGNPTGSQQIYDKNGNDITPKAGSNPKDPNNPANTTAGQSALSDMLARALAWLLYGIAYGLGLILMLVIQVMLIVATFNNFTNHTVVTTGWVVIRDICNNFFIILLLVSAVGTILHQKNYDFRTMMPKILIAAILINFSKMFFGLMIDGSQVLMLTFAAPLASSDGYNIVLNAMNLPSAYNLTPTADMLKATGTTTWALPAAMLFAVIFTFVALVVMVCITVILFYRIVYLLFLVVLSPLYFFGTAFASVGKYTNQILGDLVKYLIVGPAMMFFVYVSFTALQKATATQLPSGFEQGKAAVSGNTAKSGAVIDATNKGVLTGANTKQTPADIGALSSMGTVDGVINFGLLIGLLVGSLIIGQKMGVAGSSFAGKGMSFLTTQGKRFSGFNLAAKGVKKVGELPGAAARKVGQAAGTGALGLTGLAVGGIGKISGSKSLQKVGAFGGAWRADVLDARREAKGKKRAAFQKKLGMGKLAVPAWKEVAESNLGKATKVATTAGGALVGGTAIGLGTAAILASGGLATPVVAGVVGGLAGLLGGWGTGGNRLAEMGFGKWGKSRKAGRAQTEEEIKKSKVKTEEIVKLSEEVKNKNIETATEAAEKTKQNEIKKADRDKKTALGTLDSSADGQFVKWVESADAKDISTISNPQLAAVLGSKFNWHGGPITEATLEAAKEEIRNGVDKSKFDNYQAGKEKIEDTHKANIETANNNYNTTIGTAQSNEETEHATRVNEKLDTANPEDKTRWGGEYFADLQLKIKEDDLKTDLDKAMARIEADPTLAVDPFKKDEEKKKVQEIYDSGLAAARDTRNKAVETVQPELPKETATDKFLADYEPYAHPNWVTLKAAETAGKDTNKAKRMMGDIENGEGIWEANKGSFWNTGGQSEAQKKFFAMLGKSDAVMKQLTDALSSMPDNLKAGQQSMVLEFKKGVADFKANGGDTSQFSLLINLLDNAKLKDVDPEKNKTVSEFEEKYKPKK